MEGGGLLRGALIVMEMTRGARSDASVGIRFSERKATRGVGKTTTR